MNTGYRRYTLNDVKEASNQNLFTVISTFAGGGGSSTGYKLAGGKVLAMNEFQEVACETYSSNYPDTVTICKDIRELRYQELLDAANIKPRELDIFDGSPPCPPFSMSGSKREGWKKTKKVYGKVQTNIEDLTFDLINLAKDIQSKVIICENVKGLTMEYAREHMEKMIAGFEDIGYTVTHQVLNASYYGVAQKRERVFIIGVRNDVMEKLNLNCINLLANVFPIPYSKQPTQRDAIFDLMDDKDNQEEGKILEEKVNSSAGGKYIKMMPKDPEKYVSVGDYNPKGNGFQTRRLGWNQPSNTILEKGLQGQSHIHPVCDRGFTTKEAIRIMGLPEDFKLTGTLRERLARIGLMVAPLQLKHIAETVYQNILKPYKNLESI